MDMFLMVEEDKAAKPLRRLLTEAEFLICGRWTLSSTMYE